MATLNSMPILPTCIMNISAAQSPCRSGKYVQQTQKISTQREYTNGQNKGLWKENQRKNTVLHTWLVKWPNWYTVKRLGKVDFMHCLSLRDGLFLGATKKEVSTVCSLGLMGRASFVWDRRCHWRSWSSAPTHPSCGGSVVGRMKNERQWRVTRRGQLRKC